MIKSIVGSLIGRVGGALKSFKSIKKLLGYALVTTDNEILVTTDNEILILK